VQVLLWQDDKRAKAKAAAEETILPASLVRSKVALEGEAETTGRAQGKD
jgi:hypothetical protein